MIDNLGQTQPEDPPDDPVAPSNAAESNGSVASGDTAGHEVLSLRVPGQASFRYHAEFVERVPIGYARQHQVLGVLSPESDTGSTGSDCLLVGPETPPEVVDVLSRWLRRAQWPKPMEAAPLLAMINQAYQFREGQAKQAADALSNNTLRVEAIDPQEKHDLLDSAGKAPVVRLVDLLLFEAAQMNASDLHMQPTEAETRVRVRVDGVLLDLTDVPSSRHQELVGRIKVMGGMNIAEKRQAQDGRCTVRVGDRHIDLRMSVIPSVQGERVVMRLLDQSVGLLPLESLGMGRRTLQRFTDLIRVEHGLILVTGPTGSGKSTTLYGAMQQLNRDERNVITLEDPVEYHLDGVSQVQVRGTRGMTFANGLRSILRQDPDIIMVGEIRDAETASLAIQSALTGHLVFSTLHTNDAPSAVTRLLDLGVEPYLVASSVVGVMAQRLVRRLCPACKVNRPAADRFEQLGLQALDLDRDTELPTPVGCPRCRHTGYRGRIGLFELMVVDRQLRSRIERREPADSLRDEAVKQGMRPLRDDGLIKLKSGLTSPEELARVILHQHED